MSASVVRVTESRERSSVYTDVHTDLLQRGPPKGTFEEGPCDEIGKHFSFKDQRLWLAGSTPAKGKYKMHATGFEPVTSFSDDRL